MIFVWKIKKKRNKHQSLGILGLPIEGQMQYKNGWDPTMIGFPPIFLRLLIHAMCQSTCLLPVWTFTCTLRTKSASKHLFLVHQLITNRTPCHYLKGLSASARTYLGSKRVNRIIGKRRIKRNIVV